MDYVAPIIVFVLWIVIGNIFDKKKPPAQPIPEDWTPPDASGMPDDMRAWYEEEEEEEYDVEWEEDEEPPKHVPHHPDEYAQVHNPYQAYLERHVHSEGEQEKAADDAYSLEKKHAVSGQSPLMQAVVWAELLDKPKALRQGRRK